MSKERLDIWLKDKREQLKNATVFINENGNEAVEVSLSVLNKLFEQAERVQELESEVLVYKLENRTLGKECEKLRKRERELEELAAAYQTELSIKDNANKRIKKQNKRYREVATQAISDLENECLWDALVKLKALEESE